MARRPVPRRLIGVVCSMAIALLIFTAFAIRQDPPRSKVRRRDAMGGHGDGRGLHISAAERSDEAVGAVPEAVAEHTPFKLPQGDSLSFDSPTLSDEELISDGDAFFAKAHITCQPKRFSYASAKALCRDESPKRVLIIIHRYLLDITAFDHPGGRRTIEAAVGRGNTVELFMQHHRAFVGEQFSSICVGLVDYD